MNDYKTVVVFRKLKDSGDILALFPQEYSDITGNLCSSFEHVGGHGGADYSHCIKQTLPCNPAEYEDTKNELEKIGYDLIIKNSSRPNRDKKIRLRELKELDLNRSK
ncbi:MAG: hypothetical protein AABY32_01605 [Nanoarchaeota archaeon]